MIIKIYGERNSGTGFLEFLLRKNIIADNEKVFVTPQVNGKGYCWKHGIPREFDIKLLDKTNKDEEVLYICIFRGLEGWLKSMHKHPWHLKESGNFRKFITTKQQVKPHQNGKDYHTNRYNSADDANKDIFEIRYFKLEHHLDFYTKQKNIIHISLDFLQKNPEFFLYVLKQIYNIQLNDEINTNIPYTKKLRGKIKLDKYKNSIYPDINMRSFKHIINTKTNTSYEKYINSLKISCKLNGQKIQ